jgi:probable addiction module antidote protein
LPDILQANDAGLLCAALGDIARARGMSDIAKAAGITREALHKALRPDSAPRLDTVNRVCIALGVRLVVQPLDRKAFALGHALTTVGNKRTATEDWLPVGFGGRISANVSGCRYRSIKFYSVRRPLYPGT